jgi:4-hydroxy-tetrahydrodipicolinate reductase
MTKIGLFGAAGNLGRTLIKAIHESDKCTLAGGCERSASPELGKDLGTLAGLPPLGLKVTDDVAAVCQASDVIVDSQVSAMVRYLTLLLRTRYSRLMICHKYRWMI